MANPEHVEIVLQGKEAIAKWRKGNPKKRLDLSCVDLEGTDLSDADLTRADLSLANLSKAVLFNAELNGAESSAAGTNSHRMQAKRPAACLAA